MLFRSTRSSRGAPVRNDISGEQPTFPETPEDHNLPIYFETIDLIVNGIEHRFSQLSFEAYEQMESLYLLKLSVDKPIPVHN